MSRAIATSIFRKFSACRSSLEAKLIFESLVTPSTRKATSCPKSRSMSSVVASVSSTTSWREAGADAGGVQLELGDDARHAGGVGKVGVSALARLALVVLFAVRVGPGD